MLVPITIKVVPIHIFLMIYQLTYALLISPVPSPAVTTASDPPNPLPHLSFTSLTCNVTLDPLVDVEVELLVEWVGPAGVSQVDTVTLQAEESFYMSTLELTDLVFGVNDGSYNCSVAVTSNQLQEFIMDSETVSSTVTIEIIRKLEILE